MYNKNKNKHRIKASITITSNRKRRWLICNSVLSRMYRCIWYCQYELLSKRFLRHIHTVLVYLRFCKFPVDKIKYVLSKGWFKFGFSARILNDFKKKKQSKASTEPNEFFVQSHVSTYRTRTDNRRRTLIFHNFHFFDWLSKCIEIIQLPTFCPCQRVVCDFHRSKCINQNAIVFLISLVNFYS